MMVGAVKVHPTDEVSGAVTTHDIDPEGLYPVEPDTRAVRVVIPPSVGDADALIVTVGIWKAIPIVTTFERTLL